MDRTQPPSMREIGRAERDAYAKAMAEAIDSQMLDRRYGMKKNGRKSKIGKKKHKEVVEEVKVKKGKKGKEKESKVKTVNFKKADKSFKIETKNADWNEIKGLVEELLKTIKSIIWDVAANDNDIEKLSEFLTVQILYNCVDLDILKKVPGLYDAVCNMAERYPVIFKIE